MKEAFKEIVKTTYTKPEQSRAILKDSATCCRGVRDKSATAYTLSTKITGTKMKNNCGKF